MAKFIDESESKKTPSFFKKLLNTWDNLDRFIKSTIIVMLFIVLATPIIVVTRFTLSQKAISESTIAASLTDKTFPLSPNFFGQSVDNADGTQWNLALGDRTIALSPGVLRYPTSLSACWDWRNGKKFPDALYKCFYPGFINRDTLQQFALIVKRTGATPVFVLNMFSSGTTWDEKLKDQIEFLKTARDVYNLPIEYVELGNEISYRTPINISLFPIVDIYAEQANKWIKVLKQTFPGVQVGVSGYDVEDGQGNGKMYRISWNQFLLSNVLDADGIIMHLYTNTNYSGSSQSEAIKYLHTDQGRRDLFSLPFKIQNNLQEFIGEVKGIKKIWITEFGINDPLWSTSGTWGAALARLVTSLLFINNSAKVDLTIPHQLYGAADYGLILRNDSLGFWNLPGRQPKTLPYAYSGYGLAYNELAQALGQDITGATEIKFSPTPQDNSSDGLSYPTLIGYIFHRSVGDQAIIVNTGNKDLSLDLSNSNIFPFSNAEITSGSYNTLVIGDTEGVPGGLTRLKIPISAARIVYLPAFSVARLYTKQTTAFDLDQLASESALFVGASPIQTEPSDITDYKNNWQEIVNQHVAIIRSDVPGKQNDLHPSIPNSVLRVNTVPTVNVVNSGIQSPKAFSIVDFVVSINNLIASSVKKFFFGTN